MWHVNWATGGLTDTLALACRTHHPLVGDGDGTWATTIAGPEHPHPGTILWHAPDTIDPTRKGNVDNYRHSDRYLEPPPET